MDQNILRATPELVPNSFHPSFVRRRSGHSSPPRNPSRDDRGDIVQDPTSPYLNQLQGTNDGRGCLNIVTPPHSSSLPQILKLRGSSLPLAAEQGAFIVSSLSQPQDFFAPVPLTPRLTVAPIDSESFDTSGTVRVAPSSLSRLASPELTVHRPQLLSFRSPKIEQATYDMASIVARRLFVPFSRAISASLEYVRDESKQLSLGGPTYESTSTRVQSGLLALKSFGRRVLVTPRAFASRPLENRVDSSVSISSAASCRSTRSQDSGRSSVISSVGTTDKFTHKWPRPRSVRGFRKKNLDTRLRSTGVVEDCLEEGSGLGIESLGSWTTHKWLLMLSVSTVFMYGVAALVFPILTWYRTWPTADVMCVADNDILVLITLSATLFLLASLVGTIGTLLNARTLLAIYALLLWPALISLLTVGYTSYRRATFSLDRKLNLAWSQWFSTAARGTLQDALGCCGYFDPSHEASPSPRCFTRTALPGCKGPLLRVERAHLARTWHATFSVLPLHLINMVIALLCANHVTRRFGKGLMPRRYRLRAEDVATDAHALLLHLAKEGPAREPPPTKAGSSYFREDKESTVSSIKGERLNLNYRVPSVRVLPHNLRAGGPVGLGLDE